MKGFIELGFWLMCWKEWRWFELWFEEKIIYSCYQRNEEYKKYELEGKELYIRPVVTCFNKEYVGYASKSNVNVKVFEFFLSRDTEEIFATCSLKDCKESNYGLSHNMEKEPWCGCASFLFSWSPSFKGWTNSINTSSFGFWSA